MILKLCSLFTILFFSTILFAQKSDSIVKVDENYITLSEIVVNNALDVPSFIERIKNDTTFYKAFRNLRIINYSAINDIRMMDRKGKLQASLHSKTKQKRIGNCRTMEVIDQKITGDIYDENGYFNYYTAQLYANLFFTQDTICGEDNIIKGRDFSTRGLHGMEKHKEQLKMLFFNPGKEIKGLPFISNKTAIFDESMAGRYLMDIDYREFKNQPCYVFSIKAKEGMENRVVIREMTTWFTEKDYEIVARNYILKYDAGVYDFDVKMEIQMAKVGDLLVPALLTYNGNWKAIFKKRERGVFTATLFDFKQ